jgi:hypothetical protein
MAKFHDPPRHMVQCLRTCTAVTRALTFDWLMPSALAAWRKFRYSATATVCVRAAIGMRPPTKGNGLCAGMYRVDRLRMFIAFYSSDSRRVLAQTGNAAALNVAPSAETPDQPAWA